MGRAKRISKLSYYKAWAKSGFPKRNSVGAFVDTSSRPKRRRW